MLSDQEPALIDFGCVKPYIGPDYAHIGQD